jgi:hypothetical protein
MKPPTPRNFTRNIGSVGGTDVPLVEDGDGDVSAGSFAGEGAAGDVCAGGSFGALVVSPLPPHAKTRRAVRERRPIFKHHLRTSIAG